MITTPRHRVLVKCMITCLVFGLSIPNSNSQRIPRNQLFQLTPAERIVFTPPKEAHVDDTGCDVAFRYLWEAFNEGKFPTPVSPFINGCASVQSYKPNGSGSQNIALFWEAESALGYGLQQNVALFDTAAANCIKLLDLDDLQGHMRHEAIGGYRSYWEGSIAMMALAGFYAPAGSVNGKELLEKARQWWWDHIAVFRKLRMPDGQIALVGARISGASGNEDKRDNLRAAINAQLADPLPHADLHPRIQALIDKNGHPLHGLGGAWDVHWNNPNQVMERWITLRAFQSGALQRAPANHPTPSCLQDIYRWKTNTTIHVAAPKVVGLGDQRWSVFWKPGKIITIGVAGRVGTGKGLPNGHNPPSNLNIPGNAELVLGPPLKNSHPTCSQNNSCLNDAALVSVFKPLVTSCQRNITPNVVVKNAGTNDIAHISIYFQLDGYTQFDELDKGAGFSKLFSFQTPIKPGEHRSLNLNLIQVDPGKHTLKVWVKDVNKVSDPHAGNDLVSRTFTVLNKGLTTPYKEDFEGMTSTQLPASWSLYNPDDDKSWFVYHGTNNKAAALNNFVYNNVVNEPDHFYLPPLDLSTLSDPVLAFDYAHAERAPNGKDKLLIMISTDCGLTYKQLWSKSGNDLSTVSDQTGQYIPTSSNDYEKISVNLAAYANEQSVVIRFINFSYNGNSTLVDNIHIRNKLMLSNTILKQGVINLYPNPTTGFFKHGFDSVELFDLSGKLILHSNQNQLDISHLSNDIYLVKGIKDGVVRFRKLVKY